MTVHNTSTRLRALAAVRRGLSFAASARAAGVSAATVERWASAAGVVSARRQRPLRLATLRAAVARAPSQRAAVLLAVAVAHRARATADHVELHAVWSALDATGIRSEAIAIRDGASGHLILRLPLGVVHSSVSLSLSQSVFDCDN